LSLLLLPKLNDYTNGIAKDVFWNYSIKPPADLSFNEKKFLLDNFFMCNWETMIQPHGRYWDILRKRGMRRLREEEINHIVKTFSIQEYLDLQVWFNLVWFGYKALEKIEGLKN